MLTSKSAILQYAVLNGAIELCKRNGTTHLGVKIVDRFLKKYHMSQCEFGDTLYEEFGIETRVNDLRYDFMLAESRQLFRL